MQSINICIQLWKKARKPKSSEIVNAVRETRWNSYYDRINHVVYRKQRTYLEALDFLLQGDTSTYFGFLLPSIISLLVGTKKET